MKGHRRVHRESHAPAGGIGAAITADALALIRPTQGDATLRRVFPAFAPSVGFSHSHAGGHPERFDVLGFPPQEGGGRFCAGTTTKRFSEHPQGSFSNLML